MEIDKNNAMRMTKKRNEQGYTQGKGKGNLKTDNPNSQATGNQTACLPKYKSKSTTIAIIIKMSINIIHMNFTVQNPSNSVHKGRRYTWRLKKNT